MYEHLTFRETGDNNNIQEMSLITRRLNASTSHHATMYVSEMLKVHLPKVMELEALRLGNIARNITQPEIDKEVEVIRDEFMNKRLCETTIRDRITRRAVFKRAIRYGQTYMVITTIYALLPRKTSWILKKLQPKQHDRNCFGRF